KRKREEEQEEEQLQQKEKKHKEEEAPRLLVTPASHAFQNVMLGQHATQDFQVQNVGGGDLVLNAIQLSVNSHNNSTILTDPLPGTVLRRDDAPLSIRVQFTPTQTAQSNGTLRVTSNGGNQDVALTGTGRQLPVLAVQSLTFARTATQNLTV